MIDLIQPAIDRLDRWLVSNGWAGYDPYDVRGLPLVLCPTSRRDRLLRRLVLRAEKWFPWQVRRLLHVRTAVNAKAMGLFAEGYRQLYETTGDVRYLERARQALAWLEANSSPGYAGYCWGYPFDWQSRILIPEGTPSSVVSTTVGHAFWGFYRMTGESHYLDVCRGICEFFTRNLNVDRFDDSRVCFSYTPLDGFHVHNANLFVAEFLIRTGLEIQQAEYIDLGMQAAAYALSEQNDDGSLCYWGKDQREWCQIDHYHSGFEMRSLYGVWLATRDARVKSALDAYYQFYRTHLFEDKTIPRLTPSSTYPIEVHACAEAILCNAVLARDYPEAGEHLSRCLPWVIEHMQHPDGWFIYLIRQVKGRLVWHVQIPYIRWGQAWMLRALAAGLVVSRSKQA